jgi:hypothetical protein
MTVLRFANSHGGFMRVIERFGLAMAVSLLAAGAAPAQFGRGPQISGLWNLKVGAGGVYQVDAKGQKSEMTFAVVGKESVGGKDGYWVEMTVEGGRGPGVIITKTLMIFGEGGADLSRLIIQTPGRPPMEMPAAMTQGRGASTPKDIRSGSQNMGSESVTTPAGTFSCEHYRSDNVDIWVSKSVSPYGIVKSVSKDSTMTLTSVLTDAKDKITGTPQPFDPMKMAQQPH